MDDSSLEKRVKLTDTHDNTVETVEKDLSEEKEKSEPTCFFP